MTKLLLLLLLFLLFIVSLPLGLDLSVFPSVLYDDKNDDVELTVLPFVILIRLIRAITCGHKLVGIVFGSTILRSLEVVVLVELVEPFLSPTVL